MPRDDVTKIYSVPDGTHGIRDEIIESAKYNAFADDVRADLSRPLPIEMGGTGESTAEDAVAALGLLSTFDLSTALIGLIAHFACSSAPSGWLTCDGSAISRSNYLSLFTKIGTTYGSGNGSSTFNLPDLRGEFIRGLDLSRGIDAARTLGSAQSDDNESHSHTGSTSTSGAHTHTTESFSFTGGSTFASGSGAGKVDTDLTTGGAGSHSHTLSIDSSGTEFRPRNVALLPCILALLPDP